MLTRVASTVTRTFRNRSGRVIALCRLVLASVFLFALWIDPAQPVRSGALGYVILGSYLAYAVACLAVAWKDWWSDFRLAQPMHAIDIVGFLVAIYFTEGTVDEFTSPFLAFFAFLMLSATIRWGWRSTVFTGLTVVALYLIVGLGMHFADFEFDQYRFGRRVTYMVVLGVILVWFGLQRQEPAILRMREIASSGRELRAPLEEALGYATAVLGAAKGAMVWSESEEPGMRYASSGLDTVDLGSAFDQTSSEEAYGEFPRLFDREKNHSIELAEGRYNALHPAREEPLASAIGVSQGLAIPCHSALGQGEIMLAGISGMAVDDLEIARLVEIEVEAAFDRHATQMLAHQATLGRMRESVARDLHDTVAQSLAAVGLQLEGLRRYIAAGGDPEPEIASLKRALHNEQRTVRTLIGRLRENERREEFTMTALCDPFARLARELADSWKIEIDLDFDQRISREEGFRHQVMNIMREAAANAVRHGKASRLGAEGIIKTDRMILTIRDDGTGFPPAWDGKPPRSLAERIVEMNGTIIVTSDDEGATLHIDVPMGEAA